GVAQGLGFGLDQEEAGAPGLVGSLAQPLERLAAEAGEQLGGHVQAVEPEVLAGGLWKIEEVELWLGRLAAGDHRAEGDGGRCEERGGGRENPGETQAGVGAGPGPRYRMGGGGVNRDAIADGGLRTAEWGGRIGGESLLGFRHGIVRGQAGAADLDPG